MRFRPVLLAAVLAILGVRCDHDGSSDPLDWLRESVPGEPGVDYPVFADVVETGFDCSGRIHGGYYADPDMGCQGYHVCLTEEELPRKVSFLCPNGTIFNQQILTCEWWFNVDCSETESYYSVNELIGVEDALAVADEGTPNRPRPQQPQRRPQPQQQRPRPQQQQPARPQRPRQQQQQQQRPRPQKQQPRPQRPRQQQQQQKPRPQQQQPARPQRPRQQQQPRQQPKRPAQRPGQRQPGPLTPALAQRPIQTNNQSQRPRQQQQRPQKKNRNQVKLKVVKESEREQDYSDSGRKSQGQLQQQRPRRPQNGQRPRRPQNGQRPRRPQAPQQNRPRPQQNRPRPQQKRPLTPQQQVDIVTYDATLGDDEEDGGVPVLFADPFTDVRAPQSPNRLYEAPLPRRG